MFSDLVELSVKLFGSCCS